MLVDLARNDLGRVATAGSVHVHPFRSIERYSHVMHIVSGVNGTLAPGRDAFDLFAAAFPAGTLVGAPKVRAMEIIDELEPVRRGFYGGTVGYFGHGGDMDQAITIRTMVFHGDTYSFQAGAGIVADSVPASEYREVLAKSARAAARARARAGGPVMARRACCSIDNYDSFTYNLVQAFLVLGADVLVHRNDAITVEEAKRARADAPVHLAGPGHAARRRRVDGHDPRLRRHDSRARRLPRPPVHRRGVRRRGGAGGPADARQDLAGAARRPRRLRGHVPALRGRALPLADRATGVAARRCSR